MKNKGYITNINKSKGGYGKILDESNLSVDFELVECNYEFVRVGDEVNYDLVQIYDSSYAAINIEFRKNSILSELDSAFQKQKAINCKVLTKKSNGFIVDYKGVKMYLPNNDIRDASFVIESEITLFVKHFSYDARIICSTTSNSRANLSNQFGKYIGKKYAFDFEVMEINNSGLIVCNSSVFGFIPNSHLAPIKKEDVSLNSNYKAAVIGCSIQKGLVLSLRNYFLYDVLVELNNSFNDQTTLTGEIKCIYNKKITVDYKGIDLELNKNYLLHRDTIKIGQYVFFRIIEFNWTKSISISEIETSESRLIDSLRKDNLYFGSVKRIIEFGLLVSINENYIGFMPNYEITDNWKTDLRVLKEGSKIKASIVKFDSDGLILSRKKFIKKNKMKYAFKKFQLHDTIVLKVSEKMAKFGLLVSNEEVKGLIPIRNILPEEIIERIDILQFIKHCKNIFRRNSKLRCIVSDVDEKENKITFDIRLSDYDSKEKMNEVLEYFKDSEEMRLKVIEFYNNKR